MEVKGWIWGKKRRKGRRNKRRRWDNGRERIDLGEEKEKREEE